MGEAPDRIVLVQSEEDVDSLELDDPQKVAYITQTTLSVDETVSIIKRLKERFPAIVGPRTDDICYATTNRQAAVKQLARACDLVLVIGSRNSSNSNRLVEVAREHGASSHLIDNERQVETSGSTACGWWGSRRAPAPRRAWCNGWSSSSGRAGTDRGGARGHPRGRPVHAPKAIRQAGHPARTAGSRLRLERTSRAAHGWSSPTCTSARAASPTCCAAARGRSMR